jgi:hypothetical protein
MRLRMARHRTAQNAPYDVSQLSGSFSAVELIMSYVNQPTSPGAAIMGRRLTNRNTNRYSVTALFSMAAKQDVEVEDDLARGASKSQLTFPYFEVLATQHKNAFVTSRAKYPPSPRKILCSSVTSVTLTLASLSLFRIVWPLMRSVF